MGMVGKPGRWCCCDEFIFQLKKKIKDHGVRSGTRSGEFIPGSIWELTIQPYECTGKHFSI